MNFQERNSFIDFLETARLTLGKSKRQMAETLDVSLVHYRHILRGYYPGLTKSVLYKHRVLGAIKNG